jgi:hypothetical protein
MRCPLFAGLEDGVSRFLGIVAAKINGRCCAEKLRLLLEYRKSANLHSAHVALMADIASGLVQKEEFAWLSDLASHAHQKCTHARERFLKHMDEHGC